MFSNRSIRSFESLETRTLLAGDVMGEVVDGVLTLQGDGRENWIEIQQLGPNEFEIIGLDSPFPGAEGEFAPTMVNGSESEVFSGVRDFSVRMAGEDDFVFFNGDTAQGAPQAMLIQGAVSVLGNHGGDNILFENTTIRKAVNIRGNTGGDTIQFIDCALNSVADIRGMEQGDTIGVFRTVFRDDARIIGGDGPDRIFVGLQQGSLEGASFRESVFVHGGKNRDFIEFTETTVFGNAKIVGGTEKDDLDFNDSIFRSSVRINSGSGNDIIEVNDTRFLGPSNLLRFDGGTGVDKIRIFDSLFQSNDFLIRGGAGNDTLRINTSEFSDDPDLLRFLGGPGLLDILDVGIGSDGFPGDGNGNSFPGGFSQAGWEELV